jgi:ribosomal-protein-alanine N-acetyltransferase
MAGECPRLPAQFPVLDAGDWMLRKIQARDAPRMHAYLADPEVIEQTSYESQNLRQVEQLVHFYEHGFARKTDIRWAIATKSDGLMVGSCGLSAFQDRHARAELGYELAREAWGKGAASAVAGRVVQFAFEELQLNRIEATVMAGNTRSERVLTKLGFQREGLLREYKQARGAFSDYTIWAVLRRDWDARGHDD